MASPQGVVELSLEMVPDEVLVNVFSAVTSRCENRAVARRCRDIIERHFQIQRFDPPEGKVFCIDFEIDRYMTKHLYCARFGGATAGDVGGVAGAVTFCNWVPAYWRGSPRSQKDIRHRLSDSDACALWRLIAKVRGQRKSGELASSPTGVSMGHLTVSEGTGTGSTTEQSAAEKREVIGRLSALETDLVLGVLDHRRNAAAEPVCAAA
mmetsp:Transcript_67564/g.197738  ORF Transcript_67564/g.197738 Transcript_67564/m.197738 type:complete len:209 (+) Transcript_67564:55-681(+)